MDKEIIEQNYDWLIIFLIYNNNYYDLEKQDTTEYYTMEEQTKYILHQIRISNHNKNVKTIFVEAEIKNPRPRKAGEEATIPPENPVATLSMLYKKQGTWLSAVDKVWRDEESITVLSNGNSLQNVLMKLKKRYNAEKHMIVTAGHGSIVGINYYIPELLQKASKGASEEVEKALKKETSISDTGTSKKNLDAELELENGKRLLFLANQEICNVVKNVFTDKQLDVLVMYNCLMQNIFTQFELRETVDWLVAPLSGISIPGFNYCSVLNEISNNPKTITAEEVAKHLLDTIRIGNKYAKFKEDIEGTWKIAAVKLDIQNQEKIQRKFNSLFADINDIAKADNNIINCIYETGRFLFNYANYCLPNIRIVDTGILLEYLKDKINREYPPFKNLIAAIEDLQGEIQKLQTRSHFFEGTDFYKKSNDINYKEHDALFKTKVANIGLFLPLFPFESNLLNFIYEEDSYKEVNRVSKYNIPLFLKDYNYGSVLNKLKNLPD